MEVDRYCVLLGTDFNRYVRGEIDEQEWIRREAAVVIELVKAPSQLKVPANAR